MFSRIQDSLLSAVFLLFAALILGLTSCAGRISKKDCEQANFYEMGLEDGKDGKSTERLAKYKEVCPAEGVQVFEDRYNYGRQVGLAEFCSADKGRKDARDASVEAVCQQNRVPPYQRAYSKEISDTRNELLEEMAELQKSKDEIQSKQNELKAKIDTLTQQEGVVNQ